MDADRVAAIIKGSTETYQLLPTVTQSMPRISHEQKALYKSKIRSVLARNHQISAVELAEVLKTGGLDPERHYLGKLMKEVNAERARRADRKRLTSQSRHSKTI